MLNGWTGLSTKDPKPIWIFLVNLSWRPSINFFVRSARSWIRSFIVIVKSITKYMSIGRFAATRYFISNMYVLPVLKVSFTCWGLSWIGSTISLPSRKLSFLGDLAVLFGKRMSSHPRSRRSFSVLHRVPMKSLCLHQAHSLWAVIQWPHNNFWLHVALSPFDHEIVPLKIRKFVKFQRVLKQRNLPEIIIWKVNLKPKLLPVTISYFVSCTNFIHTFLPIEKELNDL